MAQWGVITWQRILYISIHVHISIPKFDVTRFSACGYYSTNYLKDVTVRFLVLVPQLPVLRYHPHVLAYERVRIVDVCRRFMIFDKLPGKQILLK